MTANPLAHSLCIFQVLDSQVVIHSVSISDGAESKVDTLAELTKGYKGHYSEGASSTGLVDVFSSLANAATDGKSRF